MQTFWRISQFVLGFVLGIVMTAGVAAGIGLFFLSKLALNPSKPSFPDTISQPVIEEEVVEEEETTTEVVESEPEGYRGRVIWSEGLTVRAEPDINSDRLGGVSYNQELIILETSHDETWQKIRIPEDNLEGWVKAGNLEKID